MQYKDDNIPYKTGDIVLVNLSNSIGHQQGGTRYAVVVSNNVGNNYSRTLEVLPGTTKRNEKSLPTHAKFVSGEIKGLPEDTVFEAEQKITVNKFQVVKKIGRMTEEHMERIAIAMAYATPIVIKAFLLGLHNTEKFQRVMGA